MLAVPANAQAPNDDQLVTPHAAISAASGSLRLYSELHPSAAKQNLTLGTPVYDYFIRLDEFKEWDGKDPSKPLHSSDEIIFPIQADGTIASEVTIASRGGQWKWAAFGPSNEAQLRSRYFNFAKSQVPGTNEPNVFQVTIPAMNLIFLATAARDVLLFTPIRTWEDLGLIAGKAEQAREILLRVQPTAKRINGDAPG